MLIHSRVIRFLLLITLFTGIALAEESAQVAPFTTNQEMETALRNAKVIKAKWLGTGITNPRKLTLVQGPYEFHAVFKDVDEKKPGLTPLASGGVEMDFKDSWKYDVAAYELDKIMGLNMVPVTIERKYEGVKGMWQWWVENAMTEKDRKAKGIEPPDKEQWNQNIFKVRLFDNLVHNIDRNLGNLLITQDWKVWMIDHSRSFKNVEKLRAPGDLTRFSRAMVDSLRKLDEKTVEKHCGEWLTGNEIQCMMKRRDAILQIYDRLVAEKGDEVLFP